MLALEENACYPFVSASSSAIANGRKCLLRLKSLHLMHNGVGGTKSKPKSALDYLFSFAQSPLPNIHLAQMSAQ